MYCQEMWSHVFLCGVMEWCRGMGRYDSLCGCDVVWLAVKTCDVMWCDAVVWCGEFWIVMAVNYGEPMAHDSKTFEGSIPMRRETMGCKTQKDYGELMQQYYDSELQSTLTHSNGTTTFRSGSRNTWNIQSTPRSNLWDAKRNGTTTFMFGSSNTWNSQSNARSTTLGCKVSNISPFNFLRKMRGSCANENWYPPLFDGRWGWATPFCRPHMYRDHMFHLSRVRCCGSEWSGAPQILFKMGCWFHKPFL